ncbi:MAG: 8-oxo-dGTP diphosphatase [Candidatus Spechtbacterales bacterium]|nr:8-oxo-dGTP diphosphatase [Candidatus Spechtbacterales bacterium]
MKNKYKKTLTLCVIHEHPRVLLGMKKRGFGEGKWNGFGGKVEEGEDIEEAMHREMREEMGTSVKNLEKRAIIEFETEGEPEIQRVHVFHGDTLENEPAESEEMRPQWFHIDEIPFEDMWPDDAHWFPMFFAGKNFEAKFLFDKDENIIDMDIKETNEI